MAHDDAVRDVRVDDGERPSPAVIAARIDLGDAEYHDTCCPWMLWTNDPSMFEDEQVCECGGPEMAKAYAGLDSIIDADMLRRAATACRNAQAQMTGDKDWFRWVADYLDRVAHRWSDA